MKIFQSFICLSLLFGLANCKKKTVYDPASYDQLAYVKQVVPAPPKEYVFKAKVGGESWNTTGTAVVLGDTLVISANQNGKEFKLRLSNFKTNKTFSIQHTLDSSSLSAIGDNVYEYASIAGSDGLVEISKLDEKYNQIEGTFNLTLLGDFGDTLKITDGYFKINYSPNAAIWEQNNNGELISGDSIWVFTSSTGLFEVNVTDTLSHRKIRLLFPTTSTSTFNYGNIFYNVNNQVFAYYSVPNEGELLADRGQIKVTSNANGVLRGEFKGLRFKGKNTYSINGTFSSEY